MKTLIFLGLIAGLVSCGKPDKTEARPDSGMGVTRARGACPYPTDNGCGAAEPNGSFQNSSLLTSAQQSGQNSLLPKHPMAFNIPAVDYPVGPDKTLTPKDPRTISDAVCRYKNFGGSPTVEIVLCYASGVATETLDNYDFGGSKIGKGPVELYFDSKPKTVSAGSTIAVTNSYFAPPAGVGSRYGFGYAVGFQGNWNIVLKNNWFDGSNTDLHSDSPFRDDGLTLGTTLDVEYNAFTHINVSRAYNGANSGVAATWKYNFLRGLNALNTHDHGEVSLMSCGGGGGTNCANKTIDHFNATGNFIINDTYTDAYCTSGGGAGGCINSAQFFNSAGQPVGIKYSAVTISNNVTVTNTAGAPGGGPATPRTSHIWGEALFAIGWANVGNFTANDNWVDATGSAFCTVNGPANGSDSVTAQQSGRVITIQAISSSYNNKPVEPGWQFWRGGVVIATILSMGTSTGNLGTVNVDTSAMIASDNNWTLVPGFTRATFLRNYNLVDPSNTGVATALNIGGPMMKPANCLGAHN